jgi:hypothetical protein
MDIPLFQPGDIFLTSNKSIISSGINAVQGWWSLDGKSKYTHSGIIVDDTNKTFEAVFKGILYSNLDQILDDQPLLVARHQFMLPTVFNKSFERLKYHTGAMYPFHRLFLHIIPPLAKIFAKKEAVCSELVTQLLYHAEFLDYWKGVNPDDLHNIFVHWEYYDIIYERELK